MLTLCSATTKEKKYKNAEPNLTGILRNIYLTWKGQRWRKKMGHIMDGHKESK